MVHFCLHRNRFMLDQVVVYTTEQVVTATECTVVLDVGL